ncbi:MAG TPA: DUF1206 domain-containing protein [Thermoanaerobaculia bacterium]|nr:DUF1206 domain-containing protein [Thermoanaerobaculia bacterium]
MFRNLAVRSGLGALGAVYFALGVVLLRVAILGTRRHEPGIPAALRFLLLRPYGKWLLGGVVAGLAAIAAAHAVEAAFGRRGPIVRVGLAVNAVGYAALAMTAARLLLHLREPDGSLEKAGASWLFGEAWGPAVVEVIGAAVAIGGLWELGQGVLGRLSFRRDLLPRGLASVLAAVCRFGLAARGLVLVALGYFFVLAAEELDPRRVPSMAGALRALSQTALGPILTATIAFGLCAFGVYMWTLMLLKRRV